MLPCFKLANIIAMVCDVSITSLNRLFSTDASWCYKSQLPRYKIYLVRIVKNKIRKWKPFRKHEAYREPRKSFLLIGQKLGNKINVFPGKKLTSDLRIFRSPHEEYFKMLYLLLMRIKIETCRMTEALDSGFVKLTPVFYSVNSPEAVT
jgi:hypothetical protein